MITPSAATPRHPVESPGDALSLLEGLVAIPSVNPRGTNDGDSGETRVAQFVAHWADRYGWESRLDEIFPGRANGTVRIPGTLPGTVLLQTHSDTVEVSGMTVPPFTVTPAVDNPGLVTGRGVCDAKGQLAMFMAAIDQVHRSGRPHHSVVLAACADEEEHFRGVLELCERLDPAEFSGAVVGEPTSLRMVTENKGVLRGRILVRGPGGHSSHSKDLINPIVVAARVVSHLDALAGDGQLPVTITMIHGGEAINIVPREIVLEYDRRTLPAEDPTEEWKRLRTDLESRFPEVEVEAPALADPGLSPLPGAEFPAAFSRTLEEVGLDGHATAVSYGSDASKISRLLGIPSVVFGAGSIEQAHTSDEHLEVAQLEHGVQTIASLLTSDTFGVRA